MNISAANAGTGLGAVLGGLGMQHFGLASLGVFSTVIAALAVVFALLMMLASRRSALRPAAPAGAAAPARPG